jgi:type IV pilus assembly protein PilO
MPLNLDIDFDEKLEQLAKIPKPIRLAVVSGVLIAIFAGYWFMAYQPARDARNTLVMRAQELRRQLNNALASNVPEFEAEIAGLERDLEQALKQLPNRKQFEDLLRDVSTAGKKVGVTIKSIDREREERRDFYAEVPFKLELEGSYHDLARFFETVATLPRIVNIGGMSIGIASESVQGTQLKVTARATTFRFLNDEA